MKRFVSLSSFVILVGLFNSIFIDYCWAPKRNFYHKTSCDCLCSFCQAHLVTWLKSLIKPYSIEFESFVTGHHVYKAVWSPFIGESLNTQMELDNVHDKYAVKVLWLVPEKTGEEMEWRYRANTSWRDQRHFYQKQNIIRDIVSRRQTNLIKYYCIIFSLN